MTQGKSSSIALTWRAGMSSALGSAASQRSQTPGVLNYIIWIAPNAVFASYTQKQQYRFELVDEVATSCNFYTMVCLYYTFLLHSTLILPTPVAHAIGILSETWHFWSIFQRLFYHQVFISNKLCYFAFHYSKGPPIYSKYLYHLWDSFS